MLFERSRDLLSPLVDLPELSHGQASISPTG
jgi:hypothetical protein